MLVIAVHHSVVLYQREPLAIGQRIVRELHRLPPGSLLQPQRFVRDKAQH